MGADIYDWERVHGKGSYQDLVDGGCSGGRHQAGCSHGEPPYVPPSVAALDAAWAATEGMSVQAGTPQEPAQRAQFIAAALRAAWEAVGERGEKAEARQFALEAALRRHVPSFTDPKGAVLCGGCLRPAPCPDAALAQEPQP